MTSIIFYCNEKYYRHMQNLAREGLQKYYNDPVLLFFKAYGILTEDRVQEAIRELESIREVPDVSLCALMLLIYAHKKSGTFDREEVSDLESKLKETRRSAGPKALYYAGLLLWLLGRSDKAQEYIDRMLKMSNRSNEGLVLKGWLLLTPGPSLAKCVKYFEEGIQSNKDLLGIIGKAEGFMMQKNYSGALDIINQIIVNFPTFLIALSLKMRYVLAQQDWDQSLEIAQRILSINGNNIDAFQMLAIYSLTREGNIPKALLYLKDLISALEMMEPRNPVLHFQKICVIYSLCGRNRSILQEISGFCERTYKISQHAELAADLGKLHMYQGNVSEAANWYSTAMNLDANHVEALTGIIWCQILQNNLEDAEQQLDFMREVQQSLGRSKELCYVEALLASKKEKDEKIILDHLKESVDMHFAALNNLPLGVEYLEKLDPTFIVDIVKEYLEFCPKQPASPGQTISPLLEKAATILSPVIAVAPCLPQPLYFKSQVAYLAGNFDGAQGTLQRCIELNPEWADAHLLMALIYLSQEQYSECSLSLETGVSHNFQVREHPLYHLIKAKVLEKTGNREEAIQMLRMAMSLPEMKRAPAARSKTGSLSITDRVSIYLELAKLLHLNGEQHEATKIIQDAVNAFCGTSEEIRIIVANADMTLNKGDAELALNMLRDVTPNQPYYIEVKQKMAEIYLRNRKDTKLYIGCYRELSEKLPGPQTSLLLGDAYMNIQEPEKALEVYDQAQRKKPKDATLASRVGLSLMKTHQYKKAVNYYEAALKMSAEEFLCCDLADLFLKLKNYNKAEHLLRHALNHEPVSDLPSMCNDVKFLILLGRTYKNYKTEDLVDTLNKALDIQMRILKRVPFEQPDMVTTQLQTASNICVQLAEHYLREKDYTNALKYFKDAISYHDTDNKVMLHLSRLFLIMDDLDSCEMQCNILLQDPRYKDEATMMMADIMFRKQHYDKAIEHFHQVLEKTPDNFTVLSKLINLLRRSGKLDDAPKFFDLALAASSRTTIEPGYNYCKGLHCWHLGEPNEALKYFNKARKDSDWGEKSVTNMIQVCLNPDNEIIGGEVFDSLDENNSLSGERRDSEKLGIRTAEKLLKEFHPHTVLGQIRLTMLQCYCLMATKDKTNVEAALTTFTEMATREKENVSVLLAMAQAYMILKQIPRARNQLKLLAKARWTMEDAEDLEKSWLLLADIYIKSGKYDIATELLKRCLNYNKSCCKAYEYLGFIMEKEQSYKDAAVNYKLSWNYSSQSSPAVGFRLAFNYLKDKKYVDAIDICHKVLKDHPTYPKIRKEILEKAQSCLKP
ncbi:PREDICTED: tetratricopeptide repeat protein 21A [Nanorana parkeri]|uniref:tetratricopeptide repeat protein 21A n=1 Tax=Nanorana parkeri TaxID=125878 RepID=UPI0008544EF2|nr:PREDICTED: tetratricopeptide repeat protein 21A [Nanorana parkeri]